MKLLVALALALAACAPAAAVGPTNPPLITVRPPLTCAPTSDFCYPRAWIEMPIVPLAGMTADTETGTDLREVSGVTYGLFLSAHAYTAFGAIQTWRPGDKVRVHGKWFTVYGATTVQCGDVFAFSSMPNNADLYMMTSLDSFPCAQHTNLVVLARAD